jgi:hypothetical protein
MPGVECHIFEKKMVPFISIAVFPVFAHRIGLKMFN